MPDEGVAFDVLYVDDDIVVVNKPAGLVVHPARGHDGRTLVNGLLARGLLPDVARTLGRTEGTRRARAARASCTGSTRARAA